MHQHHKTREWRVSHENCEVQGLDVSKLYHYINMDHIISIDRVAVIGEGVTLDTFNTQDLNLDWCTPNKDVDLDLWRINTSHQIAGMKFTIYLLDVSLSIGATLACYSKESRS